MTTEKYLISDQMLRNSRDSRDNLRDEKRKSVANRTDNSVEISRSNADAVTVQDRITMDESRVRDGGDNNNTCGWRIDNYAITRHIGSLSLFEDTDLIRKSQFKSGRGYF